MAVDLDGRSDAGDTSLIPDHAALHSRTLPAGIDRRRRALAGASNWMNETFSISPSHVRACGNHRHERHRRRRSRLKIARYLHSQRTVATEPDAVSHPRARSRRSGRTRAEHRFLPPRFSHRVRASTKPERAANPAAAVRRVSRLHIATPETPVTSHYFWASRVRSVKAMRNSRAVARRLAARRARRYRCDRSQRAHDRPGPLQHDLSRKRRRSPARPPDGRGHDPRRAGNGTSFQRVALGTKHSAAARKTALYEIASFDCRRVGRIFRCGDAARIGRERRCAAVRFGHPAVDRSRRVHRPDAPEDDADSGGRREQGRRHQRPPGEVRLPRRPDSPPWQATRHAGANAVADRSGSSLSAMCQALAPVFESGRSTGVSRRHFPAKGSYVFSTSRAPKIC